MKVTHPTTRGPTVALPLVLPLVLHVVLLQVGCARGPEPEARCDDSRAPFAHRGLIPRAPLVQTADDVGADLPDHDHGHAREAVATGDAPPPYVSGGAAIGAVLLASVGRVAIAQDGWRPARAPEVVPTWSAGDAPAAAFEDAEAVERLAQLMRGGRRVEGSALWWDGPEPGATGDAARRSAGEVLAALQALGPEPVSARCVDEVCALPVSGGLSLVSLEGGRLDGVLARWDGDGATITAFLMASRAPREGLQRAELGEILSIEEALRLDEADRRLRRLARLAPENPFVAYFIARNGAGRGDRHAALAGLEALAGQPTSRALAARTQAERDAEWEPLRSDPRYVAAQAPLLRALPPDPDAFRAWLLRHRASPPHLEVAVLPGGPPWHTLPAVLEAAARLTPRPLRATAPHLLAWDAPSGPIILRLGRDAAGLPGIIGLDLPPRRTQPAPSESTLKEHPHDP
jgi:hypothetical protein